MKKYRGGYEITKAMGYPPMDYVKITNFLNFIDAPMELSKRGIMTYVLTKKQVKFLEHSLENLKRGLYNLRKQLDEKTN